MRVSRLAEWVAGGVAGCPGTVDATAPDVVVFAALRGWPAEPVGAD